METSNLRRLEVARAALVVLATNCATLVLELAASRLLAPWVGSTLHTWTTIIGVVLLGIAAGSYLGGRLADVSASSRVVAALLLASSGATVLAWAVPALLGPLGALRALPILGRTVLLTSLGFLPATLLLAAVTPVLLRQLLPGLATAGRVAGTLSALGTLGSLLGNYLTGLVLFAYWPVSGIVGATAVALAALAALAFPPLRRAPVAVPLSDSHHAEAGPSAAPLPGALALHPAVPLLLVATTALAMLTLELAASRLLAPVLGVSLISWTGILGVVLVGIAAGNALGGAVADRWPSARVLALCLAASALACFLVVPVHAALVLAKAFVSLGYVGRVLAHTTCVFLLPVTALATVSPQVVKLCLTSLASAGRTSGTLWAVGTLGALVGAFLTGWLLIGAWGSYAVVTATGALLLVAAGLVGQAWQAPRLLGGMALVGVFGAVLAWGGALRSPCTAESDYFCLNVVARNRDGRDVLVLKLDKLVHSIIDPRDTAYLGYPHLGIHTEFLKDTLARTERPRLLLIGGGGYSLPRWVERYLPAVEVDVVEIDPAVTQVALTRFDLKPDTAVRSFAMDGRQFVSERLDTGRYDAIAQDAVNDFTVPWHLVTREYFQAIEARLTPGGVFFLTIIDDVPTGAFFPAVLRTMRQGFRHTAVAYPVGKPPPGRNVYVLMGSQSPIDLEGLRTRVVQGGAAPVTTPLAPDVIEEALSVFPGLTFTDDYAPVDTLVAALFLEVEPTPPSPQP